METVVTQQDTCIPPMNIDLPDLATLATISAGIELPTPPTPTEKIPEVSVTTKIPATPKLTRLHSFSVPPTLPALFTRVQHPPLQPAPDHRAALFPTVPQDYSYGLRRFLEADHVPVGFGPTKTPDEAAEMMYATLSACISGLGYGHNGN